MVSTTEHIDHGGNALAFARALGVDHRDILDLSASLNPFAPDLRDIVISSVDEITRYPDEDPAHHALASALGVDPNRLVLTNGGAEAIALVATVEKHGHVPRPTFSLYERHLQTIDPDGPLWRSNPSTPLGRLADPRETAHVWDEAFWPLATGTWSRGDADAWRLGSLTKLWACPGVRIGYVIAPDEDRAVLVRRIRPRWALSAVALRVVQEGLPLTDLSAWARAIRRSRDQLVELFRSRDLTVVDTDANWVLVDSPQLGEHLRSAKILVRSCESFGMPGWFRVAIPRPDDVDRLSSAVDSFVGTSAS